MSHLLRLAATDPFGIKMVFECMCTLIVWMMVVAYVLDTALEWTGFACGVFALIKIGC